MARKPFLILILAVLALAGPAQARPDRRLVVLQAGHAWVLPELDYTVCQPQSYALRGDVAYLRGLEGLVVRLDGDWRDGEVLIHPARLVGGPAAVQAPAGSTRGCLEAEVLSVQPPRARLDLGAGRRQEVDLEWDGEPPSEWTALSAGSLCTLEATVAGSKAMDLRVGPVRRTRAHLGPVRVMAQAGEGFLQQAMASYRKSHPDEFRWRNSGGNAALEVSDLGLTLLDCQPGQVRLYGAVTGTSEFLGQRLPDVEGRFEVAATPIPVGADLELRLVPGTLRLKVTRPLSLGVPADWSANLQALLATVLDQGFRVPLPGAYWQEMVASGAVRDSDLAGLVVLTRPTGDRRTGLLVVAGPADRRVQDPGPDLFEDRLRETGGFAVSLSAEAMNDLLDRQVPPLLPLRQTLPPQAQVRQPVLFLQLVIDAVEITELALDYRAAQGRGVLGVERLVARVHWRLGPFSGWEPGARLQGQAAVESRPGPPLAMVFHPELSDIEFLSEHLRSRSPEEQQSLRQRVAEGLRTVPLDVLLPSQMPVATLGPGTVLELLDFQACERELVLQGRWMPVR